MSVLYLAAPARKNFRSNEGVDDLALSGDSDTLRSNLLVMICKLLASRLQTSCKPEIVLLNLEVGYVAAKSSGNLTRFTVDRAA